jgi:hypothetical protein
MKKTNTTIQRASSQALFNQQRPQFYASVELKLLVGFSILQLLAVENR